MNVPCHRPEIILIDDDPLQHFIVKKTLSRTGLRADLKDFYTGLEGINHILTQKLPFAKTQKALIFLDLNMPVMDGWGFLDRFRELDQSVKSNYLIYILTSSVLEAEREKATGYEEVIGYFQKPLLTEHVHRIF